MASPDIDLGAGFGRGKINRLSSFTQASSTLGQDHQAPPEAYPIEGGHDEPRTAIQTLPLTGDIFEGVQTRHRPTERYYPRTRTFKQS